MKWQAIIVIMGLSALSLSSSASAQWFGNNNGWMPFSSSSYGGSWMPFNRSYGNGFMPYFSQSGWGMNPRWQRSRSPFSQWGNRYGNVYGNRAWPPYVVNMYDSQGAMARYAPYYPQNAQAMLPTASMYGTGADMPLLQSPLLPPPAPFATVIPNDEARSFSPFQ